MKVKAKDLPDQMRSRSGPVSSPRDLNLSTDSDSKSSDCFVLGGESSGGDGVAISLLDPSFLLILFQNKSN